MQSWVYYTTVVIRSPAIVLGLLLHKIPIRNPAIALAILCPLYYKHDIEGLFRPFRLVVLRGSRGQVRHASSSMT